MSGKVCSKCHHYKSLDEYYISRKRGKVSLIAHCKTCDKTHSRKYYQENKERCNALSEKWAKDHPEELRASRHTYWIANKEHFCAKKREYYQKNKERLNAISTAYRKKNKHKVAEWRREYDRTNKSKQQAQNAARLAIPEVKKKHQESKRQYVRELRLTVLQRLGNRCYCCGESDICFLTIDHIHGNGTQHRKEHARSTYSFLMSILQDSTPHQSYRAACYNCNSAREYIVQKICPHRLSEDERRVAVIGTGLPKHARRRELERLLKTEIFQQLGNKCYCCSESDALLLTIDHINNDGASHRKSNGKRQRNRYMQLLGIRDEGIPTDRYRLACWNCNCARHFAGKGDICPHQDKKEW